MSVDRNISNQIVKKEIKECEDIFGTFGVKLLKHNEVDLIFLLEIKSKPEKKVYLLEVKYDNYPEYPLFLEFIEPDTNIRGTKKAYPHSKGSFFHSMPCICNPCSRKSYKVHGGPHADWNMVGWRENPKVTTLKNIPAILFAIISRINTKG